jgi:alpha-N-arabinofuranosidase
LSKASGRLLTGNALDAHNTFAEPERVRPAPVTFTGKEGQLQIELPPKSVLVVALE